MSETPRKPRIHIFRKGEWRRQAKIYASTRGGHARATERYYALLDAGREARIVDMFGAQWPPLLRD